MQKKSALTAALAAPDAPQSAPLQTMLTPLAGDEDAVLSTDELAQEMGKLDFKTLPGSAPTAKTGMVSAALPNCAWVYAAVAS